jgi:hypothetical protein
LRIKKKSHQLANFQTITLRQVGSETSRLKHGSDILLLPKVSDTEHWTRAIRDLF